MSDKKLLQLYEELVEPFLMDNSEYMLRKENSSDDYNAMTCVPAFVGEQYGTQKIRLMLVGRAVNGWSSDWSNNAEKVARQVLATSFSMSEIDGKQPLNEGTPDEYNFNKCAFMNLGKSVVQQLGLEGSKLASNLIWSNLYKIAPSISGNPNGQVQKIQRQAAIRILQKEIELYKPTHILFVTDIDWLEATWRNNKEELSFAKALQIETNNSINDGLFVKAFGKYFDTKYVVCVRPEKRKIADLSRDVITAFESI